MMDARELTAALRGRWGGHEGTAICPACEYGKTGTLGIANGDNGNVVVRCHVGCVQDEVIGALRRLNLWNGTGPIETTAEEREKRRREIGEREAKRNRDKLQRAMRHRANSHSNPDKLRPYFRGRGLTMDPPPCLRFMPKFTYYGKEQGPDGYPLPVGEFQAMLAEIAAPNGDICGTHITCLSPDLTRKATLPPAYVGNERKTFGVLDCGGAIKLAPAGPSMGVAEGLENALSIQQSMGLPSWAGATATGLAQMILPPLPLAAEILIFADHDAPTKTHPRGHGQEAAETAATRWRNEGRKVRVAMAETVGLDANDLLQGKGR